MECFRGYAVCEYVNDPGSGLEVVAAGLSPSPLSGGTGGLRGGEEFGIRISFGFRIQDLGFGGM